MENVQAIDQGKAKEQGEFDIALVPFGLVLSNYLVKNC